NAPPTSHDHNPPFLVKLDQLFCFFTHALHAESRAVAKYVARKYKTDEADLLREGDHSEAAMVDVWTEVEAHTYSAALSPIVYECLIFPLMHGKPTDEKVVDESLGKLRKVLEVYEERLSKHRYLAGDFLSFADLNHFPYTFYFMATPHGALFESYPRVKAWWESIMSRPAIQKLSATMTP
uniref:glutathione transferase n=1 Tax=Aegilops tauschii subsp. strangulata TaxID=200361 RepID=A0A453ACZ3_AEGTS